MPFDGRAISEPALRRAQLVDALRHPMPRGWQWDFGVKSRATHCGTAGCALGLARLLGLFDPTRQTPEDAFGLTSEQTKIFFSVDGYEDTLAPWYGVHHSNVTPEMVADALERIG